MSFSMETNRGKRSKMLNVVSETGIPFESERKMAMPMSFFLQRKLRIIPRKLGGNPCGKEREASKGSERESSGIGN